MKQTTLRFVRILQETLLFLTAVGLILSEIVPAFAGIYGQSTAHPASGPPSGDLALSILSHVGGTIVTGATVQWAGGGNSPMPDSQHQETTVFPILYEGNRTLRFMFTFIDGKFNSYLLDPVSVERFGNKTLNDSLSIASNAVNGYRDLFNATYCDGFAEMISSALQNQTLTVENNDALLKISHIENCAAQGGYQMATDLTWFKKMKGGCTTWSQAMDVTIAENGRVTGFMDNLATYYVATTDINISELQAINISMPYAQAYGAPEGQGVFMENATLEWLRDSDSARGDCLAIYPVWNVLLRYNNTISGIYGYNVNLWADTGQIMSKGSTGFLGEPGGTGGTNGAVFVWLILAVVAVILAATCVGTYLKRRDRGGKK